MSTKAAVSSPFMVGISVVNSASPEHCICVYPTTYVICIIIRIIETCSLCLIPEAWQKLLSWVVQQETQKDWECNIAAHGKLASHEIQLLTVQIVKDDQELLPGKTAIISNRLSLLIKKSN